jgi:ferredoxin
LTLHCENVYICIGQSIEWGNLLDGTKVKLSKNNAVIADPVTFQTDEPDIFAGGDAYTGPRFAIDAIAAGKEGAISIHRFVQPNSNLTIGRNPNIFFELDKEDLRIESYDRSTRQTPSTETDKNHKTTFSDVRQVFTEEQVKTETARCLSCGATIVDENKCIGCGVCTTKCAFDAISLERERPACSKMVVAEKKLKSIFPYMIKREIKIRRAAKDKK